MVPPGSDSPEQMDVNERLEVQVQRAIASASRRDAVRIYNMLRNQRYLKGLTPNVRQKAIERLERKIAENPQPIVQNDYESLKKQLERGELTYEQLNRLHFKLKMRDTLRFLKGKERATITRMVAAARGAKKPVGDSSNISSHKNFIARAPNPEVVLDFLKRLKNNEKKTPENKLSLARIAREKFRAFNREERMNAIKRSQAAVRRRKTGGSRK